MFFIKRAKYTRWLKPGKLETSTLEKNHNYPVIIELCSMVEEWISNQDFINYKLNDRKKILGDLQNDPYLI